METYLTVEELARHLKLAEQTIRRYVLNREIPYHKIKKVIRFRLSEIETWVDRGGGKNPDCPDDSREGDLFVDVGCPATVDGNKTGETGTDGNAEEAGQSGALEGE
jgi:excisionase family DNA binding protein